MLQGREEGALLETFTVLFFFPPFLFKAYIQIGNSLSLFFPFNKLLVL